MEKINTLTNRRTSNQIMKQIDPMEVFKALSNEARLQILEWLKDPTKHFGPQGGLISTKSGSALVKLRQN
jgi:hypothetical protein